MKKIRLPLLSSGAPPAPPVLAMGSCTLVGAGPGDPELLTIKALKAIQNATVLLVDDLVSQDIVALAAPGARIIQVGKRGGCKSTPQSFIERLMITAAQEGERVVRLKGGDPFIFGRGGEEVQHLQQAGIPVTVINGISAGLAALSTLGVALTHRDHAQGVLLLTGHAKPGETQTHWQTVAATAHQARLTLVIYMGISGVQKIQNGLLQGLSASTPVALVQNVSRSDQRHAITTLGQLCATLEREHFASPCVIVVGDVLCGLAQLAQPLTRTA